LWLWLWWLLWWDAAAVVVVVVVVVVAVFVFAHVLLRFNEDVVCFLILDV